MSTSDLFRYFPEELPREQFFNSQLALPARRARQRKAKRAKNRITPDPLELLVQAALYGRGDLSCAEIGRRIRELTDGAISISHQNVWNALTRMHAAGHVKPRRDESAPKRKHPVYRLAGGGGGSHLKLETDLWLKASGAVTLALESATGRKLRPGG